MKKLTFLAESAQIERIKALVRSGEYPSVDAFVREAVNEKLEHVRREHLAAQVARYCAEGHADEDGDLVAFQAFDSRLSTRRHGLHHPRARGIDRS